MVITRNVRRGLETSPTFVFTNTSTIVANAVSIVDWESQQPTSLKYLPFNKMTIVNNGESDITLAINQNADKTELIPKGTIFVFEPEDYPAISTITITNIGTSTITASKIKIRSQRLNVETQNIVTGIVNRLQRGRI